MDRPQSSLFGAVLPRVAIAAFGLVLTGALGGCVETAALSGAETPAPQARLAGNAAGVRVALASLSGVPEPLENRLKDAFVAKASERNITVADPARAAYLIRGYVTTYPAAAGTTVAAVYDVFDARKNRAQRLEDDIVVKGVGADPWAGFDALAMEDLAARSADDLAAFLVTTPEALAAAEPEAGSDPLRARSAAHAGAGPSAPSAGAAALDSAAQGPVVAALH